MRIRPEHEGDLPEIRSVHEQAFGDDGRHVADLADALKAAFPPGEVTSLVAETTGSCSATPPRVVGHVLLTPALLDAPRRLVTVLVLSPLGVLPEQQHRGLGTGLVRAALAAAAASGAPAVFLEGPPAFYGRLGFRAGGPLGFRRPSLRIPPEAFQVALLAAQKPWMTGTLVYPAPFWELDAVGLRDGS